MEGMKIMRKSLKALSEELLEEELLTVEFDVVGFADGDDADYLDGDDTTTTTTTINYAADGDDVTDSDDVPSTDTDDVPYVDSDY